MEDHYQTRGMLCRRQLGQFQQQSHHNMQQLGVLREDLKTVLSLLMMFLEKERLKGVASRHRGVAWSLQSSSADSNSRTG